MNLKFFILGLYVLVSIAQVKTAANGIENAELNGKPDQFKLMEFISRAKRNLLSNLFQLKADDAEALDKVKRQEPIAPAAATTPRPEEQKDERRFNPMEALSNMAQKPVQMALKQAMSKLFASYQDTSKPFGPTYDTTWGSPPSNRKMNGEDRPTDEVRMSSMIQASQGNPRMPPMVPPPPQPRPDEVRMSTMIQPPPGYSGYHTYESQKRPLFYGAQSYGQSYRNMGHSLEPSLPYQQNYDSYINGKQAAFSGPPPGYFPYNPQDHISQDRLSSESHQFYNRRANAENLEKRFMEVMKKSPEEIKTLIAQMQKSKKPKGVDEISMRNGFMGDVYDKSSEEKNSGEAYSNTQVEFSGPQGDVMSGNRRFSGNDDENLEVRENMDKLVASTFKGLGVIIGYLRATLENETPEQIGERFVQIYDVLKNINSYFKS